jgi:hypothetical protein
MPSCKILQLSMALILSSHSAFIVCPSQARSVCKYPSIEKSDERLMHMIPASLRRARNKSASAEMAKNATEQRDKSCSPDTMNGAIKIIG